MSVYLVTYQLNTPGQDYDSLYDALDAYDHINPINTIYFIATDQGAVDVKDELKTYIGSNDALIVIDIREHWGMTGVGTGVGDWIKDHN